MSEGIEKDYIEWLEHLFWLREKYKDTPPGFADEKERDKAREKLRRTQEEYKEKNEYKLMGDYASEKECFVGRQEYLKSMEEQFAGKEGPVVLYGIAGIGKTALAREYIRRHQSDYDKVLFLSYHTSLQELICDDSQLSFSNLRFSRKKYENKNRYFKEKIKLLCREAERNRLLLVIDDCSMKGDPKLEMLLDVPCDFLFTTRMDPQIWGDYRGIYVKELETEGEWSAFRKAYQKGKSPTGQKKAFFDFCSRMKGHTLLMKLFIQGELQPEGEFPQDIAEDVFARYPLKKDEKQALRELSIMPAQGIAEEIYRRMSKVSPRALQELTDCLLVCKEDRTKEGYGRLTLHPAIAEAARKAFIPTMSNCHDLVEGFTQLAWEMWKKGKTENRQLELCALAFLKAFPQPVAWMARKLDTVVTFLWIQGYHEEAKEYWKKVVKAVEANYGEDHQMTAEVCLRMAAIYYSSLNEREAENWYLRGFQIIEQCKPYDRRYYFVRGVAYYKISRCCRQKKEYEKGLAYAEEAIRCVKRYRDKNRKTEISPWDIRWERLYNCCFLEKAKILMELGRFLEAEEACRRLKKMVTEGYGRMPWDGETEEAEQLLTEIRKKSRESGYC